MFGFGSVKASSLSDMQKLMAEKSFKRDFNNSN